MSFKADLITPVIRYKNNPIVTNADINRVWEEPQLQTITVHNAGITEFDGEVLMLFRSHLRNGVSVLGIARSKDGLSNWTVDQRPALVPCSAKDDFVAGVNVDELIENEQGGLEDARITKIADTYLITYSAYHAKV